jgi:hypothetical protein
MNENIDILLQLLGNRRSDTGNSVSYYIARIEHLEKELKEVKEENVRLHALIEKLTTNY